METIDYQKQAVDFLNETKTEFFAELVGHDKYFPEDKQSRDIYQITLKRAGKKPFVFRFGQSIKDSGPSMSKNYKLTAQAERDGRFVPGKDDFAQKRQAPTAYCVLAGLTKYDPETFEDFCANYGYDLDSRKAEKVYFDVQKEYAEVCRLWNEKEREALNEIN